MHTWGSTELLMLILLSIGHCKVLSSLLILASAFVHSRLLREIRSTCVRIEAPLAYCLCTKVLYRHNELEAQAKLLSLCPFPTSHLPWMCTDATR